MFTFWPDVAVAGRMEPMIVAISSFFRSIVFFRRLIPILSWRAWLVVSDPETPDVLLMERTSEISSINLSPISC